LSIKVVLFNKWHFIHVLLESSICILYCERKHRIQKELLPSRASSAASRPFLIGPWASLAKAPKIYVQPRLCSPFGKTIQIHQICISLLRIRIIQWHIDRMIEQATRMAQFIPRAVFPTQLSLPRSYFLGHHASGLSKMKTMLSSIDLIIECRDYRVPLTSRNPLFEQSLAGRERLVIYTKRDLGSKGRPSDKHVRSLSRADCNGMLTMNSHRGKTSSGHGMLLTRLCLPTINQNAM
jgi:hypothetical protein